MKLKPLSVSSEDLLLDPRNPRLVRSFSGEPQFDVNDPVSCQKDLEARFQVTPDNSNPEAALDRYIQDEGSEDEQEFFSIKELKDSMRNIGFVGIQNIIVREHEPSGKFVVLEGNRRVAAIKSVLREHDAAAIGHPHLITDKEILTSLKTIEVMVFETAGRDEATVQHEISTMLGLRHYGSQLMWEPLPRAKNIFDEYMRLSTKEIFEYVAEVANQVASTLAIEKSEVQAFLRAYICYCHLADMYPVKNRHFSLIMAGVQNRSLINGEFFGFHKSSFEPTGDTAEKFDQVCEFESRDNPEFEKILPKPQSFAKLGKLLRESSMANENAVRRFAKGLFDDVINKQTSLETAYSELLAFKKQHRWVQALEALLEKQAEGGDLDTRKFMPEGQELQLRDNLNHLLKRFLAIMDS